MGSLFDKRIAAGAQRTGNIARDNKYVFALLKGMHRRIERTAFCTGFSDQYGIADTCH